MKKKIIFILLICLLCIGCEKKTTLNEKEEKKETKKVQEKITEEVKYKDLNTTPIGIYSLNGNKLTKIKEYNTTLVNEKDIGIFQIYPSNDDIVYLNNNFGESYYNEWIKYPNIKLGFNIKFSLNTKEFISYNILGPQNTFDKWEYLMNYIYDDYANRNKSFYSHLETTDITDSTLFTSFKMQSSYKCDMISSNIILSVFTYDSDDDFLNNEYRGNSIYSITIINNK